MIGKCVPVGNEELFVSGYGYCRGLTKSGYDGSQSDKGLVDMCSFFEPLACSPCSVRSFASRKVHQVDFRNRLVGETVVVHPSIDESDGLGVSNFPKQQFVETLEWSPRIPKKYAQDINPSGDDEIILNNMFDDFTFT